MLPAAGRCEQSRCFAHVAGGHFAVGPVICSIGSSALRFPLMGLRLPLHLKHPAIEKRELLPREIPVRKPLGVDGGLTASAIVHVASEQ